MTAGALTDYLAQGWAMLKLSVEAPDRAPGWDAVVLTAASERQAWLYEAQLDRARRRGRIGPRTRALAAPDPGGRRIGSGGATLNALRLLAGVLGPLEGKRVLLIHAGGDSRRAPWANIMGKPFAPLPLLADEDDAPPTLFDHLLAMSAPMAMALEQGGLVTLSGDVLPLFDAGRTAFPADGGVVVAAPVSLDVAQRHGVVAVDAEGRVTRLFQKAPAERLAAEGALVGGGAALVDTGVWAFTGAAYRALADLAGREPAPAAWLAEQGREISLYEEVAAALVPAERAWLAGRALGRELAGALGGMSLAAHRADEMEFVHLGTTAETLDCLGRPWQGRLARRILAETSAMTSESALVYMSRVSEGARVGSGSLAHGCRLGGGARIGSRCVVMGVDTGDEPFVLPDNCCLWQAPLSGGKDRLVTLCCGVDDNPKEPFDTASFCNRGLAGWMRDHGVEAQDLWRDGEERTVWTARLFPVLRRQAGLSLASWMLARGQAAGYGREAWLKEERLSLAEVHEAADAAGLLNRMEELGAELALRALRRTVEGALDRNARSLAALAEMAGFGAMCGAMADRMDAAGSAQGLVPRSRTLQICADLLEGAGRPGEARRLAAAAFEAVGAEVAEAIESAAAAPVQGLAPGRKTRVDLPVRFDIAGGWSDTPPYCLERPAKVLNLAMTLDGRLPVGVEVEALDRREWALELEDRGLSRVFGPDDAPARPGSLGDPFLLPRTALALCGYGAGGGITQGVRVRTWARVPRGSGLGTSSILGAALVMALQRLAGRADDAGAVSRLVLTLEQMMTTGGGWQDQIGGLAPGVKLISSVPTRPVRLLVEPAPLLAATREELERRLVIVFTGQERLAKNVLQIVVGRYLRRDGRLLAAIRRLVELADEGRRRLVMGDVDGVGEVMAEAWHTHQQLDPHCSNPGVDALFRAVAPYARGAKLAGAGGGGFMGVVAKDADAAGRIRRVVAEFGGEARVYAWGLWLGKQAAR